MNSLKSLLLLSMVSVFSLTATGNAAAAATAGCVWADKDRNGKLVVRVNKQYKRCNHIDSVGIFDKQGRKFCRPMHVHQGKIPSACYFQKTFPGMGYNNVRHVTGYDDDNCRDASVPEVKHCSNSGNL
jgi:hypothetical protein